MPFVQKYKSGGGTRDLKKEPNEYVYETPKEPEVKQEQVDNTPKTSTIVETNKPITDDKLTINGVELSKKKLIPYLEKKSFSATGVNRLAWDKTLDALKKVSTYNTSDSLDVDYGNNVKFDLEELKDRGNRVLADILKEASSGKFDYEKEDVKPKTPLTLNKFLGTELGLGVDYNPTEHNSVFTSFEVGNMEPEYIKNKSGVYVPKYKGKNIVYSKNLSTINRANIISKYLDKAIEEANSSDEGTKFLNNTLDKTEWLKRLNEAKNSISNLYRTTTIKNAVPAFYRIGIDINQLFNNTPVTPIVDKQGTPTETPLDQSTTDKNVKANNNSNKNVKPPVSPVVTNKINELFNIKPGGLPEHLAINSNFDSYIINSLINPFLPDTPQYINWNKNPVSNPYDANTQKASWDEWNKKYANVVWQYKFNTKPTDLNPNVLPKNGDYSDAIVTSVSNPYKSGTIMYDMWKRNKYANPYIKYDDHDALSPDYPVIAGFTDKAGYYNWEKKYGKKTRSRNIEDVIAEDTWSNTWSDLLRWLTQEPIRYATNAMTEDELENIIKKRRARKGQQGMSIDKKPYSILNYFEETPINTSNSNTFNKFGQFAQYKSIIDAGKKLTSKDQQKFNMFGDLENNLFNKLTKTPLENTTINKSLSTQPTNTKSSTVLKQNVGDIKNTEKVEKGLGSYTIRGLGDLANSLISLGLNEQINNRYINSLKYPEASPQIFTSAKVFQDQSNIGDILASGNGIKPVSSDLSSYYGAKKDFNEKLMDYLLKEQQQQAVGIRQDRAKVAAIEDARNKENSDIAKLNESTRVQHENDIARIQAEKDFKQGEIITNSLKNITEYLANKKDESAQTELSLEAMNHQAELDNFTSLVNAADKLTDATAQAKEYERIKGLRIKENENYLNKIKGRGSKFFTNYLTSQPVDIFK